MSRPDPLVTARHRLAIRANLRWLLANQAHPLSVRRRARTIPNYALLDAIAPASCWVPINDAAQADELVRSFVRLLPAGTDPHDALVRWIAALRFLSAYFEELAERDVIGVFMERWEIHWRYWLLFAIADLGPSNRLPKLPDVLQFVRLGGPLAEAIVSEIDGLTLDDPLEPRWLH